MDARACPARAGGRGAVPPSPGADPDGDVAQGQADGVDV